MNSLLKLLEHVLWNYMREAFGQLQALRAGSRSRSRSRRGWGDNCPGLTTSPRTNGKRGLLCWLAQDGASQSPRSPWSSTWPRNIERRHALWRELRVQIDLVRLSTAADRMTPATLAMSITDAAPPAPAFSFFGQSSSDVAPSGAPAGVHAPHSPEHTINGDDFAAIQNDRPSISDRTRRSMVAR
jgi:hypothetical protein